MATGITTKKRIKTTGDHPQTTTSAAPALDDGFDLDLSSDIKGILAALHHVRQKAQKDGKKRNEELLTSVATEIKSMVDEVKSRNEKERQNLIKAFTKMCKDYEAGLKNEYAKYQSAHERYSKERNSHTQTSEEMFSKFEEERDKLLAQYDQHRKKEKAALLDVQKACAEKLAAAEESLKKKNQEEKSLGILRRSLGSFLESNSDDDLDE